MEKLYEVEISRHNVTPRQFFTYCQKQMKKRTGYDLENWCESFEDWEGKTIPEYSDTCKHDDWDDPVLEICKTKAFDWQMFLGKAYNFIMEFQFDDEKTGYGYMYAIEYKR